jgi:hypothetical protein
MVLSIFSSRGFRYSMPASQIRPTATVLGYWSDLNRAAAELDLIDIQDVASTSCANSRVVFLIRSKIK